MQRPRHTHISPSVNRGNPGYSVLLLTPRASHRRPPGALLRSLLRAGAPCPPLLASQPGQQRRWRQPASRALGRSTSHAAPLPCWTPLDPLRTAPPPGPDAWPDSDALEVDGSSPSSGASGGEANGEVSGEVSGKASGGLDDAVSGRPGDGATCSGEALVAGIVVVVVGGGERSDCTETEVNSTLYAARDARSSEGRLPLSRVCLKSKWDAWA